MFTFSGSARVCHVTSTHTNVRRSAAVSCVLFLFPEAALLLLTFRPSGWFTRDSRCQKCCLSEKLPHQGFSVSDCPEVYTKVTFFRNILCIYCLFVVYYWSKMVGYTRYYYAFLVCDIKLFVNVKDLQNFKHKCIYFCAICVPNSSLTSCSIGLELICIMPVYGVHWLNSLFAPPSNSVCSCGEDEIQIW